MEHLFFKANDGTDLEGIINRKGAFSPAAVITHPHPLYGGTMNNYVLDTVESAFSEKGYTTLRFNFRGVGRSSGSYGDGMGEVEDVLGALALVKEGGAEKTVLVGYSFGSWVNAHVPEEMQASGMAMISPPLAMMDFKGVGTLPSLKLIVTGALDKIAPPSMIEKAISTWNTGAALRVIEKTDHFFGSSLPRLKLILKEFF
jgi:uncharacterized protein